MRVHLRAKSRRCGPMSDNYTVTIFGENYQPLVRDEIHADNLQGCISQMTTVVDRVGNDCPWYAVVLTPGGGVMLYRLHCTTSYHLDYCE